MASPLASAHYALKNISSGELGTLQENLIKSHACSVGEEIRPVIIKLMMLLKSPRSLVGT